MINVTFTEEGNKLSLRLEGHAGYAEIGKDIVCASASIIAYTLASNIEFYEDVESVINLASGDTTIECRCDNPKTLAKLASAYHFAELGYALLQHNYPQYVRLQP